MLKVETLNLLNKSDINFKDLLSICIGKTYLYQRRFIEYIGKYNHWDVDLSTGMLTLDDKKYNIECIGTTSKNDPYWYSSEIEKVIPDKYVDLMIKTRVKLENLGMPQYLTNSKIALNENINGFNLSMIYIAFAPINVAYFCGKGDTSIYMFVKSLPENIFSKLKSTELFSLITDITSNFNVNAKLMIKALLMEMEYNFVEENNKLITDFSPDSKIEIEFDGDNFSSLRGVL